MHFTRRILYSLLKLPIYNDSTPTLTKPYPQKSSSFPDMKHITFTARDAVDEMGGGASKCRCLVLFRFICRKRSRGMYELTSFTSRHPSRERTISDDESSGTDLRTRVSRIFCSFEQRLAGYRRKWKVFGSLAGSLLKTSKFFLMTFPTLKLKG